MAKKKSENAPAEAEPENAAAKAEPENAAAKAEPENAAAKAKRVYHEKQIPHRIGFGKGYTGPAERLLRLPNGATVRLVLDDPESQGIEFPITAAVAADIRRSGLSAGPVK